MTSFRYFVAAVVLFSFLPAAQSQIIKKSFVNTTVGGTSGSITNSLAVAEGEVWELLQGSGTGVFNVNSGGVREFSLPIGAPRLNSWNGAVGLITDPDISSDVRKPLIVGPATLEIVQSYTGASSQQLATFITYRKINQQLSPATTPSNTVVIPTDAIGPVEIVMESSVDLVNWTAATPGTYGASTEKRFFRLRAVVTPAG
jgi:hypothetical protein